MRIAKRYAKALISLTKESDSQKEVFDELSKFERLILDTPDLKMALLSPLVSVDIKVNVLQEIFKKYKKSILFPFFELLIRNNRYDWILRVIESYKEIYRQETKIQIVKISSVALLTKNQEKSIVSKLKDVLQKDILLENKVDPSLLGGMILQIGDLEYNASLKNSLNRIKKN